MTRLLPISHWSRIQILACGMALGCFLASRSNADIVVDFEAPAYTAGSPLNGQNGWYLPAAGGASSDVLTYAGNPLSVPNNPTGGNQFAGLAGPGTTFGRSQLDHDFTTSNLWTIAYDVCHRFNGDAGTATQNLASFSVQNPAGAYRQVIALHTWVDPATATNWNAGFNVFDATGAALVTQIPGAEWQNLLLDNWYRESLTIDAVSNSVLSVSITDLSTNTTTTFVPTDWYLDGGLNNVEGLLPPTAIRMFTGGTTVGNVAAWDNVSIQPVPEPSSWLVFGLGVVALLNRRQKR